MIGVYPHVIQFLCASVSSFYEIRFVAPRGRSVLLSVWKPGCPISTASSLYIQHVLTAVLCPTLGSAVTDGDKDPVELRFPVVLEKVVTRVGAGYQGRRAWSRCCPSTVQVVQDTHCRSLMAHCEQWAGAINSQGER